MLDTPGEIKALITMTNLNFEGELKLPLDDFKNVKFQGQLMETEKKDNYKVSGNVDKNLTPYSFTGAAEFAHWQRVTTAWTWLRYRTRPERRNQRTDL